MSNDRYINFEPKKSGFRKDKNAHSLLLDMTNKTFEYTFAKRQPKSIDTMLRDTKISKNPLDPLITRVSVTMRLEDVVMVEYDEALSSIMIVGAFCVTYTNSECEVVRNYEKKNNCFSLAHQFEDIQKFVDIIERFEKSEKCSDPLVLVNL